MKKLSILLVLIFIQTTGIGQTVLWDGGANTHNWEDAANWNGNVLPCTSCTALILSDSVSISSIVNVRSVFVGLEGNPGSGILTITAGKGKSLNITNPSANGLTIHNSSFYNYGALHITGGGSGSSSGFEAKNGLTFLNNGSITVENYAGTYAFNFPQITTIFLSGTITMKNCVNGLNIYKAVTNDGEINFENCSGVSLYIRNNFTNNGTLNFMNQAVGVQSFSNAFNLQRKLINTTSGKIYFTNGSKAFDGYETLALQNSGIVSLEDVTEVGDMYLMLNDSLVTINHYDTGLGVIKFTNNKQMNFANTDNTAGIAIIGKEFTNNGNLIVNHAMQAFKTAAPYTGHLPVPTAQFNNEGNIEINDVQNGIILDSVSVGNFAAGVIRIDSFQHKAIQAKNTEEFFNFGHILLSNQFQEDTTMLVEMKLPREFENSENAIISITNAYKGFVLYANAREDINNTISLEGKISINNVKKSSGGDLTSFGLLTKGVASYYLKGILDITNVKGNGWVVDSSSTWGINIYGTFKGKNNTISIVNNAQLTSNANNFRVISGGLIYSRGDSLYSVLDNTPNLFATVNCGIIDVVNIKKDNNIVPTGGLLKLNGMGSDFNLYSVNGLLIDPYGDIYSSLSNSTRNSMDISFGIGGATSSGLEERNFLKFVNDIPNPNYSGFFLDSALTIPAGTFNSATNTFTPSFSIEMQKELYFQHTRNNCSYFSSIPVLGGTCIAEVLDNEFTGAIDNDWHKPENWSLEVVPTICHKAIIQANKRSVIETGRKARAAGIDTFLGAVYDIADGSVVDIVPAQ